MGISTSLEGIDVINYDLGIEMLGKCMYTSAIGYLMKAVQENSNNLSLKCLGMAYLFRAKSPGKQNSDYTEAEKYLAKYVNSTENINDVEAILYLGQIFEETNRIKNAFEIYRKAIDINPNCMAAKKAKDLEKVIVALWEDANKYFNAKDYNNALQKYIAYEKCIELHSVTGSKENIEEVIGLCYFYVNQYESSVWYLQRALKKTTKNLTLIDIIAQACENTNDFKNAFKYYKEAFVIDQNCATAIKYNGIINIIVEADKLFQNRQYEQAMLFYEKALKWLATQLKEYISITIKLYCCSIYLGNDTKAKEYKHKTEDLELNNFTKEDRRILSQLYERIGDSFKVQENKYDKYYAASKIDPNNTSARNKMNQAKKRISRSR